MAFGFGFNKQKVLSAAEKCVQQGKLENAIAEYQKILKHDAKDLTVMNTIGDLYSRLGESDKAAECFKSVGDAYASQGFTVKAIAMYKKLSKLKPSTECVLRLAELYTQQGLFNDARAQYLIVAEDFIKSGQLDQGVRIFEKTLEMDPDNVAMRTKLAEVYIRLGKKEEAWKILSAAAETLRTKGQLAAADEIVRRMLKLDPSSSYALALRGRAALDSGDAGAAIESLSKVADLDTNPEGMRALFHAYLSEKRFEDAGSLANKLASLHNDSGAISEYSEALMNAQEYRKALAVYEQHADTLLRSDPAKLAESLRSLIGHLKDDTEALQTVLALFEKVGENTNVSEIYELLAHAYVQSGELEKARDCYAKLMQLEPANQMHAQNHQQVIDKLGNPDAPRPITPEEGAALVDELETTAPFIDQHYTNEVALAVQSALTDAELFISYNMGQKALAPLLNALPRAPRDLRLNQKLAALHIRAGRFAEAAVCCRTLESIYQDAGHAEEANRYAEIAAKYEERGGTAAPTQPQVVAGQAPTEAAETAPVAQAESAGEFEVSAPVPEASAELPAHASSAPAETMAAATAAPRTGSGIFFHARPSPAPAAAEPPPQQPEAAEEFAVAAAEPQASETDGSEWEDDLTVEAAPAQEAQEAQIDTPEAPLAEIPVAAAPEQVESVPEEEAEPNLEQGIEEVRFYLGQGMTEQAEEALAKLEAIAPGSPDLAVLRLGIESAKQQAEAQATQADVTVEEVSIEEAPPEEVVAAPVARPAMSQPWPQAPMQTAPEPAPLEEIISEIEESIGDGFAPEPKAKAAAPPPAQVPAPKENKFRPGTLDEFVSDLEASLGSDFGPEEPVPQTPAPAPVRPAAAPTPKQPVPMAPVSMSAQAPAPIARAAVASATPARAPLASTAASSAAPTFDSGASVDLANMFGELKHELEEGGAATAEEDPETHYNLGVAFREMGLLDEAIGEFQKVCQATQSGRAFSQMIQTYTWLAQCFLDKGVPEAAIQWYEKALQMPSLDQETRTALHYELGSSLETAGNKSAALNNFMQVYSSNIDYRDVAERIKALKP